MRILTESLSLDPLGGIELCTLEDSIALATRGHQIDVLFTQDGLFRSRYEENGIGLNGPFSFDIDIHHPIGGVARSVSAARWARAQRPEVLWLSRIEHIYWAQMVARWSNSPIVCHLHNMPHPRGASQFRRTVAHFVAVSEFLRQSWIDVGVKPERISVIKNAVSPSDYPRGGDLERTAARESLGISFEGPMVLYYGRMLEDKGVGTLLDAWKLLGLGSSEAQLLLVGSMSPGQEPVIARKVSELDGSSSLSYPMQMDMIPFLHASDIVIFPSWLEEGFGRVVVEGLATGRPVVASRVGAVPEILSGPMERFLVAPRNSRELAGRISTLLDWRKNEPALESQCVNWVDENFSYEDHVLSLEETLMKYRRRV